MTSLLDHSAAYKVLRADPAMKAIIKKTGTIEQRKIDKDIYGSLLRSITGQQLSVKAAATIHQRFLDVFPKRKPHPETLLSLPLETLRGAGLSMQKSQYLKSVAEHALAGELDFKTLNKLEDEALISHFTRIKGIGVWSAQMVMMFALQRPDVFPTGDLGIQQSMKSQYGIRKEGKQLMKTMEDIAVDWRPFRTLACLHLWAVKDL
ncbi:MAG: DNA-3-methyladenine glycosylase family protein [Bacteroidia bacterium]